MGISIVSHVYLYISTEVEHVRSVHIDVIMMLNAWIVIWVTGEVAISDVFIYIYIYISARLNNLMPCNIINGMTIFLNGNVHVEVRL